MKFGLNKVLPPLLFFLVLSLGLEILVYLELLNRTLFPPPSEILRSFQSLGPEYYQAFLETFYGVGVGFLLSIFCGTLTAILFSLTPWLRRSILPFAIFFQTVPIIAIAPLLVIYFGFGPPTVIAAAFIVSIFPIIANTLVGLDSAQKSHLELFQIYKASPWQTLWRLKLASAYLSMITGIKVSAGLAVIGAVAGEFVAGGGLGALIDSARTQQRIDIVFAAILILSGIGLFLIGIIHLVDRLVNRWRPLSHS